jgi:hypothetical protein
LKADRKYSKVIRMYSGDDGESHFEDLEIPQTAGQPGDALFDDLVTATGIYFRTVSSGLSIDYHTAPLRQFAIPLTGLAEFEVGDGSTVRIGPGDILLADDTTGHGHVSRTIEGPRQTVYVPIPEDLDISSWRPS